MQMAQHICTNTLFKRGKLKNLNSADDVERQRLEPRYIQSGKKKITDKSSSCAICLILYKYNAALNEIFF